MSVIATKLIDWHKQHGRHDLPWQASRDPYAIWLSEIMLQQTQVTTVIPYYVRFMREFPTIRDLGYASLDTILALWSGLGYYSRARNLHLAARQIIQEYHGQFPQHRELIQQLPGIGRSTAAAIAVFAFGQREAILDGNVKRIFARYFGISGYLGERKTLNLLWLKAEASLPVNHYDGKIETYTQALMDLGATVCTRHNPLCQVCPLQPQCVAWLEKRVQQLPAAKPRKPLPQKEIIFLLLMQQQKLLLEKRPENGIWGGLWCPPEIELSIDSEDYCQKHLGIQIETRIELAPFDHQFTHFKLRIYPWLLRVLPKSVVTLPQFIWIKPSDALKQGIPAPVRKLLERNFLTDHS